MSILVTGAGGYIGQQLVKKLLEQGEEIRLLVRDIAPIPKEWRSNEQITFFAGDITEPNMLKAPLTNCKYVYHLAAYAKPFAKNQDIYYNINVIGTQNILRLAQEKGVEKIVYTSTAGVYGAQTSDLLISETQPHTNNLFTEYEKSKLKAEEIVKMYANKGLNVVIVNPTRVYGQGNLGESNAATKLMKRYLDNTWHIIPGNGKNVGNYVYVDDVVQGILLAMQKGRSGENYLIGGENLTYDDFFELIATCSGIDRNMFHVNDFAAEAIASGIQLYSLFTEKPPLISPVWVKRYLQNYGVDISKAVHELGYQPTPAPIGFQKTIDWLNAEISKN
jgi:nucleoside-diphosphate-sugar epimerase